jgi:hypothetical protein
MPVSINTQAELENFLADTNPNSIYGEIQTDILVNNSFSFIVVMQKVLLTDNQSNKIIRSV